MLEIKVGDKIVFEDSESSVHNILTSYVEKIGKKYIYTTNHDRVLKEDIIKVIKK